MGHLARDLAEAIDALAALLARLQRAPRHRHSRHAEHEPRIDAVVAGLDAFAGEHAGVRPFARRLGAGAGAQNVDDAGDDRARLGFDAPGSGHRADLDALAAAGAGVRHGGDACLQCALEGFAHAASVRLSRLFNSAYVGYSRHTSGTHCATYRSLWNMAPLGVFARCNVEMAPRQSDKRI